MAVNLANAVYGVTVLIALPGYMRQQMAGQAYSESVFTTVIVVGDTVIGIFIALALLLAFASYKRWTWAFFADIAYLAIGLLSFPSQLSDQLNGGPHPTVFLFGDAVEFASAALIVWMVIALIKYGVWASPKLPGTESAINSNDPDC